MSPGVATQRVVVAEQGEDFHVSLPHHLSIHDFLDRFGPGVRRLTFVQAADGRPKLRQIFHDRTEFDFAAAPSELNPSSAAAYVVPRGSSKPVPAPPPAVLFVSTLA